MRPVFYQRRWEPNLGLSRHTIYRILFWVLMAFVAYRVFLFGNGVFDRYRATGIARVAATQFTEGRKADAMLNLKLALTYDKQNPEAARLMAHMFDAEDNPLALEYHGLVAGSGDATAEDLRLMALSAIRHGNQNVALEAATKNRELGGDPAFPDLIEAQILALRGDSTGREKALRAALQHRETSETLVALADFLLSDPEHLDKNSAEAASLLRRAAEIDKRQAGLLALRKGLVSGILSPADHAEWMQWYLTHPAADTSSRLDAMERELAANPDSRVVVLQKSMELFRDLPIAEKAKAAHWLLEQGEARAALEMLPYSEASTAPGAIRVWIEAVMAQGDWCALEAGLKKPSPTLDDAVRLPLLARAIKRQGRAAEADEVYAEALQKFQSNPAKLSEVLAGILAAGEWDLFEKNLTPVVGNPQVASSALRIWVPIARSQRSSAQLLGFYEKALASPILARDPYLLDRIQFCRLILGLSVPIEDIEHRLTQAGNNPNYMATAALGYLQNGRKARALKTLEGEVPPVDTSRLLPSRQAAAAAVFAANDRAAEAKQIASRISRQNLTIEEAAFLEQALKKVGVVY